MASAVALCHLGFARSPAPEGCPQRMLGGRMYVDIPCATEQTRQRTECTHVREELLASDGEACGRGRWNARLFMVSRERALGPSQLLAVAIASRIRSSTLPGSMCLARPSEHDRSIADALPVLDQQTRWHWCTGE